MRTLAKLSTCFILSLLLSACFVRPYKFDVIQGNPITADQVSNIREGMSEEDVRYALGTPMLQDVFHTNRWDYVYYDKPGYKTAKRNHVAIFFEHGRVAKVTRDEMPESVA